MLATVSLASLPALWLAIGPPFPVAQAHETDPPCEAVDVDSPAISQLRREQQRHLEAFNKFPDGIEVGRRVWEDVWEWHVRVFREAPAMNTDADGRYFLTFRDTHVVLRNDAPAQYVGMPFDR
jgi:hypothetical protein